MNCELKFSVFLEISHQNKEEMQKLIDALLDRLARGIQRDKAITDYYITAYECEKLRQ